MWGTDALGLEAKSYPGRRKGQESQLVHFNPAEGDGVALAGLGLRNF